MNAKLTRLFLGVATVAAVAACVVNLSFTYPKNGVVVAITDQTSVNQSIPIDLSTQSEVAAHKDNVKDLTLDSLDATVRTVTSGSGVTITGKLWLRPDGATDASKDVLVGAVDGLQVQAGNTKHLAGSAALDALVLSTIKGSGKATALVIGSSTGQANFTLDLALHVSMSYEP